jgi:glyoxylase-like metal-dependent hydrolase (beta-lactamase superfamily II)
MSDVRTLEADISLLQVALDDYDVRGALVVGARRAVVWDTLSHPRNMDPVVPLIGDRDLVIVYSHADWDHIWGTAGLPYARARIVAHVRCRERFESDVPLVLTEKQASAPGRWNDVVLVPPTETFASEWSVNLGGMNLVLHHLPGHTPDCIVGFIPERGVLLAGDTVETPCPVVPKDSPLESWIAELRRWAADARVRTVVPAHGPIGGREILEENVTYLEGILSGRPIGPRGPLTPFYRATHEQNLRWQGRGGAAQR